MMGSPLSFLSDVAITAPSVSIGVIVSFAFLATLVLGGAVLTITRKNLISAVMSLIITFFGLAGLYVMLSAPFLAAIQILVYAGGIMVLFIFVIMVLNKEEFEPWSQKGIFGKTFAASAMLYLLVRLGFVLYNYAIEPKHIATTSVHPDFGSVQNLGKTLFTDFLFPFEAISLLLLIAMIGAVVIARGHVAHPTSHYEKQGNESSEDLSHQIARSSHAE